MRFFEPLIYKIMEKLRTSGENPDALAFLNLLLKNEKTFDETEELKKLNVKQKYELVQTLLALNKRKLTVSTPCELYKFFISNNLSRNKKMLFPDIKTGETLLNFLFESNQKKSSHFDEIFCDVVAFCSDFYSKKVVEAAVEFIFNKKIEIKEDFIYSNIEKKADVALCNPPFAKIELQNPAIFKLSFGKKSVEGTVLFIEKIYNSVKKGARVSIIVPNSLLELSLHEKTRFWIKEKFNIEKIVSLPQDAFKPAAAIKTSILFLIKDEKQNENIEFAVIKDLNNLNNFEFFKISKDDFSLDNFSAEFYQRKNSSALEVLNDSKTLQLSEIACVKKDKAEKLKNPLQNIDYIDISSVEAKTGLILNVKNFPAAQTPKRAYYEVCKNDLIIAVSGAAIGTKAHSIAVVDKNHDGCICSNGFRVLTLKSGVNPYYLWYFMRSDYFLKQVALRACGSTILNLKEKDFLSLKVVIPSLDVQNEIAQKVLQNIEQFKKSEKFLYENEQELKNILAEDN